jgi:hypothetical protein
MHIILITLNNHVRYTPVEYSNNRAIKLSKNTTFQVAILFGGP